jgi:hypothetical protein
LVDLFPLEPSGESSQSNANEHPRSGDARDFYQLTVRPVQLIGDERRWHAQGFGFGGPGLGLALVDWRGQLLGLGLSGSDIYHQDPLRLERTLALRWLN